MEKHIIYHGNFTKVENPVIKKGKFTKDFGPGFYCTILEKQAEKWAKKFDSPILNLYEYQENSHLKIKNFTIMTEEWLDFIINSRKGIIHNYDIVVGPMADDQVYNYITDLMEGNITREAFWELAKFQYPTHQIAFCTKESLKCLKFYEARSL